MAEKKRGLGKGLNALFDENFSDNEGVVTVALSEIEPNRDQPRRDFDEEALSELADSISKHGLLQPIIVRPMANGRYQIIAGERRWRACRIAELHEVPIIVKEIDDQTLMELALIENLQREDLNAVEEAMGYKTLMENYGLTQEKVAETVGKSRSAVANALRLLGLNEAELEALRMGAITAGHARALLACEDETLRQKMLIAASEGASVRELEKLAAESKKTASKKAKAPKVKNSFYSEVELSLRSEIHRKVNITSTGKGRGTITIEFYNDDELAEFARRLADEK
ncbi:MAG: ParB/RepB/Spo0J family partition protein [Ruminococcaceae bacterium]|nr:ParB/RepB/Spo0J family partition protein [Oscillospiraceae bacterium]